MILSPSHWSYDISHSFFPTLPLEDAKERINHNLMVCLMNEKQATPESLHLSQEKAVELEYATLSKSDTRLCTLCAKRITGSKFGDVAEGLSIGLNQEGCNCRNATVV